MNTHLIALAVALTVTGLAVLAVDNGMRDGAERARLADPQLAAAKSAFTF